MALLTPASLAMVSLHFSLPVPGSAGAEALMALYIAFFSQDRALLSCTSVSGRCHAGLTVDIPQPGVPSGVQSPTGRPPLASPGQPPPPQRSASERALQPGSATSTPGKAPGPAAGAAGAAVGSKGMPIKGDRGRFKVYEVCSCK